MKTIILSALLLMLTTVSFAQQLQSNAPVVAKTQLVELIEEYNLTKEQASALKNYYKLDALAASDKISAADLQQKKEAVLQSLKTVLPEEVLTKLNATLKNTGTGSSQKNTF